MIYSVPVDIVTDGSVGVEINDLLVFMTLVNADATINANR